MKRKMLAVLAAAAVLTGSMPGTAVMAENNNAWLREWMNHGYSEYEDVAGSVKMYRLYNPNSGEHFYTADDNEAIHLRTLGWNFEGVGWYAPKEGTPVYRLYNKNAGDHFYTASRGERNSLIRAGWTNEGIGWHSGGNIPLYRQYNPNAKAGSHNYTTSKNENDVLTRKGWKAEGIAWHGTKTGKAVSPAGTVIAGDYELQRNASDFSKNEISGISLTSNGITVVMARTVGNLIGGETFAFTTNEKTQYQYRKENDPTGLQKVSREQFGKLLQENMDGRFTLQIYMKDREVREIRLVQYT